MKKYKAIVIITYLLLSMCGFSADYFYNNLPEVSLAKAQVGRVRDTVSYSGVVYAKGCGVYSSHSARAVDIYVREGQYVQEGELLARLDLNDTVADSIRQNMQDIFSYSGSIDENTLSEIFGTVAQESIYDPVIVSGAGIRAPADGYIRAVTIEEGAYVGTATPLFIITDMHEMGVRIQVAEDRISEIAVGQVVSITGSGFGGRTYYGNVIQIAKRANQSLFNNSGAQIAVNISLRNPDSSIMPGFTATANIQLGVRNAVAQIPLEMIDQDETGKEFVWIYRDGHVHKEYIHCRYTSYGYAEVSGFDTQKYLVSQASAVIEDGDVVRLADGWKTW